MIPKAILMLAVFVAAAGLTLMMVPKAKQEVENGVREDASSKGRERTTDAAPVRVRSLLEQAGFAAIPDHLTLIAIKDERTLEVWGEDPQGWRLIHIYPFTTTSGTLGPKLRQGDLQIPEGLYRIEYLNPNSAHHLSMKVSYPNDFDRRMARRDDRTNLGGDIMIHGGAASIGCIPIGDPAIEELYHLVSEVGRTRVEVLIAPTDFRRGNEFPEIEGIDWEEELYRELAAALSPFENPGIP
jgi:murein L,D-transpeptidase YafK